MTDWRSPTCRERVRPTNEVECEICARRRTFGVIVEALSCDVDEPPFARSTLDALDAIAELLAERQRTRRAHNQALREESREAQRGARDAYYDGIAEGRAERSDW